MKSHIRLMCAVLLAVASCAPVLSAQTDTHLKMQVPFAFQYGPTYFAPGMCRGDMPNPMILRLTCGSRTAMKIAVYGTHSASSQASFALFKKYGDRYFLEEIQTADAHITIIESKTEKRAARELAAKGGSPTLVEVALLEKLPGGAPK